MAVNISKYLQITPYLLAEYEFNKDAVATSLTSPILAYTSLGTKYFYEGYGALNITNNILPLNSIPTNTQRTNWFLDSSTFTTTYPTYWDASIVISTATYPCDTIKLHIVSGYNFDDVAGFLLQVRALNNDASLVDIANFTYAKQAETFGNNVVKFAINTLYLGNRFYDKYVEFKVPSIQALGNQSLTTPIETLLDIKNLSDVYLTYSTITEIVNNEFTIDEIINAQLPVTSSADNFNCFIAESTEGDYIEYYALWNGEIIGSYMSDIESGIIKLYTSNNPNDNYTQFVETYGTSSRKWVIIHEISVYEQLAGVGGTSLLTQKFSFTQDGDFSTPNYFRPILRNADIDASYVIQYTCRLNNRMDGTQIIRKASFASQDPKKYGLKFTRLNIDNIVPYKIFNRIEAETINTKVGTNVEKTKYIKVFFDTTNVLLSADNEVYPQGTGPLFLKSYESTYKFKFEKLDSNGNRVNVDLSGAYNYALYFKLTDNTNIEVGPTYSTNMNTTIGELEFKLTETQVSKLLSQTNNSFNIIIKNPNGTSYSFYQGTFYSYTEKDVVISNYNTLYSNTDLLATIGKLQAQIKNLTDENNLLKTT